MPAIHEYRRYAFYPDSLPFRVVPIDFFEYQWILTVFFELFFVQPQFLCDFKDLLVVDGPVMRKKFVVEFPEFSLALRGKGCCRRCFGEFVTA